jgi:hypothetical protein
LRFLAIGERGAGECWGRKPLEFSGFWGKFRKKSRFSGIFLAFCASKRLPDWQRLLE